MNISIAVLLVAVVACNRDPAPASQEQKVSFEPAPLRAIADPDTSHDGAVCLAMTLAAFGKPATVAELQPVVANEEQTATALGIIRAAQARGLRASGVKISAQNWGRLRRADIVHLKRNTFAVVERLGRDGLHVVDPGAGPVAVSEADLSGVAILFELPGDKRFRELGVAETPP